MKRLFLMLIIGLACAGMDGNRFVNDKQTFEIRMPDGWSQNVKNTRKEISFQRGDGITEVSVDIIPMQASQADAQAVAKDQVIAYDGWQYVAGRELAWNEKRGGDTGFSAMYTKNILNRYSPQTRIIAQEFYLVKNRQAYVVTLLTDSERWRESKAELMFALNSFKIY